MNILVPIPIDNSSFASCTIAEPDTGEVIWVSANYAVGDRRIRVETHSVYECVTAHTAKPTPPEEDQLHWLRVGPTNKWAAFDNEISTQSQAVNPLTFVLEPGFFNAISMYGLEAANATVTIKDESGGIVVFNQTYDLTVPPFDWYDWAFGRIRQLTKLTIPDLVPYPNAELTITLTAAAGVVVKVGMIVPGDYISLVGNASWAGAQYGSSAELVDFSNITTDSYGNTSIRKRRNATDMRATVSIPANQADAAVEIMQSVLAIPCAWVATEFDGFNGLNVFGLGSGSMTYDEYGSASLSIYVKGLV